jgi:hypothetical protein
LNKSKTFQFIRARPTSIFFSWAGPHAPRRSSPLPPTASQGPHVKGRCTPVRTAPPARTRCGQTAVGRGVARRSRPGPTPSLRHVAPSPLVNATPTALLRPSPSRPPRVRSRHPRLTRRHPLTALVATVRTFFGRRQALSRRATAPPRARAPHSDHVPGARAAHRRCGLASRRGC